MTCERFSSLLDDYLSDRLENNEIVEFKEHAENCASCKAILNQYDSLKAAMADIKEAPVDFVPAAMEEIKKLKADKRRAERRKLTKIALGAASAVAALLIAVVVIKNGVILPNTVNDSQAFDAEITDDAKTEEMNGAEAFDDALMAGEAAPMDMAPSEEAGILADEPAAEEAAAEEAPAADVPAEEPEATYVPAEGSEAADEDNRGGFADRYVISVNMEMWELKEKLGEYPEIYDFSVFDEYSVSVTVTEMNVGDINALLGEYLGDVTLYPGDEVVIELV